MKISYDYDELIDELKGDLAEGLLKNEDFINIVRDEKLAFDDYKPIIDYYFLDAKKTIMLPLEALHNREEYSDSEWNDMLKQQVEMLDLYQKDEPRFEKMKVSDVMKEMEEMNRIL